MLIRSNSSSLLDPEGVNMRRYLALGLIILCTLISSTIVHGAGADDILGVWNNQEKTARIEVMKCGDVYCGKIVWLEEPNYPEGSTDGVPGTPKLDHKNPVPEKRKTPVMGLPIVNDMRPDGEKTWSGGTVYDPKNGKTYKGKLTLIDQNRLDLRGYIGISLIGRTAHWTR